MKRRSMLEASLALGSAAALAIGFIALVIVPAHEQMAKDRTATLTLLTKLAERPPAAPASAALGSVEPVRIPQAERPAQAVVRPAKARRRGPAHRPVLRPRPLVLPDLACTSHDDPLCDKL